MGLSSNARIQAIPDLVDELFQHVLYDEEPLFVSDEATLLDVSASPLDELISRCESYYKVRVSTEDLKQPLWQLLPKLRPCESTRRLGGSRRPY